MPDESGAGSAACWVLSAPVYVLRSGPPSMSAVIANIDVHFAKGNMKKDHQMHSYKERP